MLNFVMSAGNGNSMALGAGNSMPPGAGNSMQMAGNSMTIPQQPAGQFSMPIDAGMSFPIDAGMSFPIDAGMSIPIDAGMSMPDETFPITIPADTEDACDDESNPSTPVSKSFEVDGPIGILTDILTAAIEEDFTLCPSSSRMLWETERDMEESVVLGVTVTSVAADDNANCADGAADECEVATADFDVIHKQGSSSEEAADEFLTKLSNRIAEVDGVREADETSSSPDPSTTETKPAGAGSSEGGLGGGEKAAVVICSVAVVAVALVLVQRKRSRMKHDDDKSTDGSLSTAAHTSAYTGGSNSIFS